MQSASYQDWLGEGEASSIGYWDQEKIESDASHWHVDMSYASVERLEYHLVARSNMKKAFLYALYRGENRAKCRGTILDIGCGLPWTASWVARFPEVQGVYAMDIGLPRLLRGPQLFQHLHCDQAKLKLVRGDFKNIRLGLATVDMVILNGALHHCYTQDVPRLFSEMYRVLKPGGVVCIANEHYVDGWWYVKKVLAGLLKRGHIEVRPQRVRQPAEKSGEHWRTRREVEAIFNTQRLFRWSMEDLWFSSCDDKRAMWQRLGWHYYVASLTKE